MGYRDASQQATIKRKESFYPQPHLKKELNEHCDKTKTKKSEFIEDAVREKLQRIKEKQQKLKCE